MTMRIRVIIWDLASRVHVWGNEIHPASSAIRHHDALLLLLVMLMRVGWRWDHGVTVDCSVILLVTFTTTIVIRCTFDGLHGRIAAARFVVCQRCGSNSACASAWTWIEARLAGCFADGLERTCAGAWGNVVMSLAIHWMLEVVGLVVAYLLGSLRVHVHVSGLVCSVMRLLLALASLSSVNALAFLVLLE